MLEDLFLHCTCASSSPFRRSFQWAIKVLFALFSKLARRRKIGRRSALAWIVRATVGEGAGSCHLDKYEFLSPVYNPFNHTCYSVGRGSSFELDVTTSWRGNRKNLPSRARITRSPPGDTIRFLYNRSNEALLVLFFPPFCPRYRALPSTISIGKMERAVWIVTML